MTSVLSGSRRSEQRSDFPTDLRPSSSWALVLLVVGASVLALLGEILAAGPEQSTLRYLVVLLYALAGLASLANARHPLAGHWILIAGLVGLICLVSIWLDLPTALALMSLPVLLSGQLSGLVAAGAVAAGETALLGVLLGRGALGPDASPAAVALVAIWVTWIAMLAVYRPIYGLTEWVALRSENAARTLEEARDRKAELEQALETLLGANRQLELANERIAALRQVAEQAQRAKAQFVANVSHEFRTPLNMIIGLVNLMVDSPHIYTVTLPPEMAEDLEIVRRNCQHLGSMINDVLSLSQIGAQRLALHKERVDLAELVGAAVESIKPLIDQKGLELVVATEKDLPLIYCDRTRIRQVVLNLVSNAARFTERGRIDVETQGLDGHVLVRVRDTGPGIPLEESERIFEPFYQATSEVWRDRGGTGLGLTISREFVRRHGGRMWLESEPGVGTTFTFELPISAPPEPIARPGHQISEGWAWREDAFLRRASVPAQFGRPRIIVWDQSGGLVGELDAHAEDVEFVCVDSVRGIGEGLSQAPAHAVIVNARAPDQVPGLVEAARGAAAGTPLLGCAVPRRIHRALQAGAAGYLLKPVAPADLRAAINSVGRVVKRVLVVDDDSDFVRMLTRMLQVGEPGLQVVGACDGEQALEALRTGPVDLVLLDVVMPGLDGWQVLERKNQDRALQDIPAFLVSAHDPLDEPPVSSILLAAADEGLTVGQVLGYSLQFSAHLLSSPG